MGWTSYCASHYKYVKGKRVVDRKAEMDEIFKEEDSYDGTYHMKTLKSAMVGSTYYAAIERIEKANPNNRIVFAVICLTSTNMKDYFNFAYKDMEESMGPYKYDCPKGILDLLTPTESEYANKWRKLCRQKYEETKKNPNDISNLRVGSKIRMVANGRTYELEKRFGCVHLQSGKVKRIDTKWTNGYTKATTRCIKSWGYEVLYAATKEEEKALREQALAKVTI